MTMQQPGTATPARRRARWERYRVTHPFSATTLATLWGLIAALVAVAALFGWALDMKGGVIIVAVIPFIFAWFDGQRTAFQFDVAGVRVGPVQLPWHDVTQFVVAHAPDGRHTLIGVRLRPGATLPPGVTTSPQHPAMPAPFHVAVQADKFDMAKLVQKARKYAPQHVRIVAAGPVGEQAVA